MHTLLFFLLFITGVHSFSKEAPEPRPYSTVTPIPKDSIRTLEDEVQTLEVCFIPSMYLLNAPSWIDKSTYYKGPVTLRQCFHIEPADSSLDLPQVAIFDYWFVLTGRFYTEPFCPQELVIYGDEKATKMMKDSCAARVFRYTEIELIHR